MIDASAGSEQGGKDKMAELMEFGRRVASAFKVAPEESRVGLVTYATDAQIMMNFHRFSDPDALTEARNAVRVKPHTGKYTGQALSLAKEGLFDTGHRSDALDVLILMTDGPSSDDVTAPARALRDMGVKIICVGVGPQIDKAQLNDMASDPDEEHVFVADYDNLATIIRKTQKAACVGKKHSFVILHKKLSFPLCFFRVDVAKSAVTVNSGYSYSFRSTKYVILYILLKYFCLDISVRGNYKLISVMD